MKIIFYTDRTRFTGDALESYGLGGSESAVINLSRELVKLGHEVNVYCNTNTSHIVKGVVYHSIDTYRVIRPECDVFISSRSAYGIAKEEIKSKLVIFWSEDDLQEGAVEHLCSNQNIADKIDILVSVSDYAKENLRKEVLVNNIKVIRNGYNDSFIKERNKVKGRFVYTSTPFRGLDVLLEIWPEIHREIPDSELYLFTGMSLYNPGNNDHTNFLYNRAKRKEGVILHDPVCQRDLLEFLSTCDIMLYPNHYVEASCMSVIEALAASVPVVTSNLGALPELINNGVNGSLIDGHSRNYVYQENFIKNVINIYENDLEFVPDQNYTWKNRAIEWENLIKSNI